MPSVGQAFLEVQPDMQGFGREMTSTMSGQRRAFDGIGRKSSL